LSALPSLPPNFEPPDRNRLNLEPPRRRRWRRLLGWIAIIVVSLILAIVVGIGSLLHSDKFHDYVLRTAQQKITASLGSNVQVQNYTLSFHGISPTLDIYGLVVHGAQPYPDPPVLMVEHIRAGVQVVSLLKKQWYLNDAEVHHPVVQVFVDRKGVDNLPKPQSGGQKSSTNIFDLGVRHAVLDQGEIYYNNRKSVVSADLKELTFHAGYDVAQNMYSGTLSYRNGDLQLENYNPTKHDMDAEFSLTPQTFTLKSANLRSGNSSIALKADATDYSTDPKLRAQYAASIDAAEFRHILKNPSVPSGILKANGTVEYANKAGVAAINLLKVSGDVASAAMNVQTPSLHTTIRNISAQYSLTDGNLIVRDIRALLLGGAVNGTLTMQNLSGATRSHLRANLKGVQLASLKTLANSASMKDVALTGHIDADADATWGKTLDELLAKANATLAARVGPGRGNPTGNGATTSVPMDGLIHATYSAARKQITLADSHVRTPKTSLNLNGTVSDHSALQVHMQSNDLHELETVGEIFRKPTPGQPVQPMGLYGTANFNGSVSGTTAAPHLTGKLAATDLRLKGSAWKSLRTDIDASPSSASLQNGELDPASKGRITFALRTGLTKWSFTENSPIQVSLNASQLNVADLAKAAGSQTPVAGTLSANVQLHGTQLNPIGQGSVDFTQAKVSGETIQNANIRFNGTGDQVHSTLKVQMPAGIANAVLTYLPKQQGYDLQLHANNFQINQIAAVKSSRQQIAGVINLDATGHGTIKDPQLTATLQIPKLDVQNQTLSHLMLRTDVANHLARIALDSDVIHSHVRGGGTVALTGNYDANLTLDTEQIPFAPLVAIYAPSQAGSLTGATELHATVRGPLKQKSQVEAHVTIPLLNANYKNTLEIAAPSPIHLDYVNGVLNLQKSALRGTGTDLTFQGTIPVVDRTAPVSLLLLGTVDLRIAQLVSPDISSSGQLKFNINSYGQRSDPNVQGRVDIVNAAFVTPDAPLGLSKGNGTLVLTKDRLNIESFEGTVGGGKVNARGGVLYRPEMQFDLALAGHGIRLLYPDNVRTGMDMNLTLTGTTESALLGGTVNVDQLSFTPDFDLMETMGNLSSDTEPPPAQGFTNDLNLQIAIHSTSGINLVNRQLSLQGAANLTVRGTAAQPVVLGRINLTGGDLIFRGNRYKLDGGTVQFVNPSRTEPSLNMAVSTSIQQYNISMRFEGPVDHLRTSYTSDPSLPPSDIISLIAFGKTDEASAANPNPPGALGAESLVASGITGQVTNRVEKIAGISHLSIDPTLGGSQSNPGATVTVQQRVTSKIFVTFSTDVTSTQSQTIQLEYQKSPRLSLSGTRDQNGGFAVDARIKKNW
jgi:translocation and assembly module TamB